MHVVIGCPVYKRPAQIRRWIQAVRRQDVPKKSLAFVLTDGDHETAKAIKQEATKEFFEEVVTVENTWGDEGEDRNWSPERVEAVARKRNCLLKLARHMDPDYFLSLDSDVEIPPDGLPKLLAAMRETKPGCGAISPKVWIWNAAVAAMTWEKGLLALVRRSVDRLIPVDVLPTAACLMTKKLLFDEAVNYGVSVEGRDYKWVDDERRRIEGWPASEMVYWSKKAKANGYGLYLLGSLTFEHKMQQATTTV